MKRIVTSKGFAVDLDPPRSQPAAKLPLMNEKIQLKENIACYWLLFGRDSEYWPVIGLITILMGPNTI